MTQKLTLEQQYGGKKLPDAEWAKILNCDAQDIPEFRDYLQSARKISIQPSNQKYKIYDYHVTNAGCGAFLCAPRNMPDSLNFLWKAEYRSTILFDTVDKACNFVYQTWLPELKYPDNNTINGKQIPEKAYLMFEITPQPIMYIESDGVFPALYKMTPREIALYKKYHTK